MSKPPAIPALTSLRFFAALFVYLRHLSFLGGPGVIGVIYTRFFIAGYIGVTFFFVLSGFILAYNYSEKFKNLDVGKLMKFYRARIARIYPLHLMTFVASIFILLPLQVEYHDNLFFYGVANIFLVHGFPWFQNTNLFNTVSWSLSSEMFFYILFPFLLWFVFKIKVFRSKVGLAFLLVCVYGLYVVAVYFYRDLDTSWKYLFFSPFARIGDFVVGVLLAIIFLKIRAIKHFLINNFVLATLLELFCLLVLFIQILLSSLVRLEFRYSIYYLPIMLVIIFLFAIQGGVLSRFLTGRELVYLGEISFSFYMVHQMILLFFRSFNFIDHHPVVVALLAFNITLVVSFASYHFLENPMRKLIKGSRRVV